MLPGKEKCFKPPGWRSETLKQQPSDSCSPCARHFLTATNLILSPSFYTIRYKNATEILGPAGKICRTAMIKSEGQTTWRFSMCLSLANPLDSAFFQVPQLCLHVADQIQSTVPPGPACSSARETPPRMVSQAVTGAPSSRIYAASSPAGRERGLSGVTVMKERA